MKDQHASFTSFAALFRKATGGSEPFPYQVRFAESDELPELVHAPTGAGKTATAVLGWLWRLKYLDKPTPRRLVYCLPMRVLVEQTREAVRHWLTNLGLADEVAVHVLMGGEAVEEWDLYPEKPAILIGTQDMLLSRALNRGYGMSRYRWPLHFALLNNDALWVLDEIQLMGTGLATSTQLQAFREALGVYGVAKTIWMSATLLPEWLASVDYRNRVEPQLKLQILTLDPERDYVAEGLRERWKATKPLGPAVLPAQADAAGGAGNSPAQPLRCDETAKIGEFVRSRHKPGSLTLVIVNTVDRARGLFEALRTSYQPRRRGRGRGAPLSPAAEMPELRLIHSRFRSKEREAWRSWLTDLALPAQGRIVISTQVVEAGVDLSARTLITELAPWASLVQRFGRCNRRGEFRSPQGAEVFWIDVPTTDEKKCAPYSKQELDHARDRLRSITDVGLKALSELFDALSSEERLQLFPFDPAHVIRRKDFIELFDTTPDLAGNDIDISRFIRDSDEIDVQVFWRINPPPREELTAREARAQMPVREELCSVPVGDFREFLKSHTAYRWDPLSSRWTAVQPDDVYPGQIYWIVAAEGGYDRETGWNPKAAWSQDLWLRDPDAEVFQPSVEEPSYDTELLSIYGWRSIAEHTDDVVEEVQTILQHLPIAEPVRQTLTLAVRWHDWGKAHPVFQGAIRDEPDGKRPGDWRGRRDVAKAPNDVWRPYERKHFRHELASALGVLTLLNNGDAPEPWASIEPHLADLALYLIAAHHGKVRLSIRSMPDERHPVSPGTLFARGVWQEDSLPAVELGEGITTPQVAAMDLSPMQLGQVDGRPSWAERMLRLRDSSEVGPFRLAYLEALVRAADMRASRLADQRAKYSKGGQV